MNDLLNALALVMIIEGVLPLVTPARWREVFARILAMSDGQIRFIGLVSILMGAFALLWLR